MGLYIKGMEMPTNDELLYIKIYPNGKVAIDMDLECKQIATAVSVPPHGRLINADALINTLQELFDKREKEQMFTGSRGACVTWNDAIYHIKSAPTVDAVPVVRCKDCKHRPVLESPTEKRYGFNVIAPKDKDGWEDDTCPYLVDDGFYSRYPNDDDFCAWAERRTDNA